MIVVQVLRYDNHRTTSRCEEDRMNDGGTTRRTESKAQLRAYRSDEALVAQYIRDRSDRHARTRQDTRAGNLLNQAAKHSRNLTPREAAEVLGAATA
jgi:hypothetical protein